MKLTTFLLLISILTVSAKTAAQKITLTEKQASLEDILSKIGQQSGYNIFFDADLLATKPTVDINLKNAPIEQALTQVLKDANLSYEISDKTVIIKAKEISLIDKIKSVIAAIEVRGRVVDESDQPLVGATVRLKGNSSQTLTDNKGEFSFKQIQPGATIVISYIGYDPKEVKAAEYVGAIKLNVTENKLNEVRVLAYGATSQRLTTANTGGIKAEDIEKQPVDNPLLALQGRIPGIQITQQNGVAGGAVKVKIQGAYSFNAGVEPFYVVDGVPYNAYAGNFTGSNIAVNLGSSASGSGSLNPAIIGSPLDFLNPNDIETIEVLKDAAATAIYGSRAANGAIIITTKKGKPGDMRVEVNSRYGISDVSGRFNLLNGNQVQALRMEYYRSNNLPIPSTAYDLNGTWDKNRDASYQNEFFGRRATDMNNQLTLSGGSSLMTYLIGANYSRSTAMVPGDFSDRKASVHFNIQSYSANRKFSVDLTGSYLADNNNIPKLNVVPEIFQSPQTPSYLNPDGSINWALSPGGVYTNSNNVYALLLNNNQLKNNMLVTNLGLKYNIIPGLDFKTNLGYTLSRRDGFAENEAASVVPSSRRPTSAQAYFNQGQSNSLQVEPQISFHKNIAGGELRTLIGATYQRNQSSGFTTLGYGYLSDELLGSLAGATTFAVYDVTSSENRYFATFASVNYNYQNKYLLDLIGRRDGSSRFGINNRFKDFGAIGFGWLLTEEKSLKFPQWLSLAKLKTSYGTTGNDQIGDYTTMDLYSAYNSAIPYAGQAGMQATALPTPNLQWETTSKLNFGVDLGFANDHFLFSVNYAINRISNFLMNAGNVLPSTVGFSNIYMNFPGIIQNTSLELSLNTNNVNAKDFAWTTNLNFTVPKQKLVSYPSNDPVTIATHQFQLGYPLSEFKVYHFLGVDPATGVNTVADVNGNPTTNPNGDDQFLLMNTEQKYYGGISNKIIYKDFQLDFFFQYVKQVAPRFLKNTDIGNSTYYSNQPSIQLQRWQQPGDVTPIQKVSTSNYSTITNYLLDGSDEWYENASYLRLKNIQLSWSIPHLFKEKLKIQDVKLFLQGQNLITFTKYSGLDPESQGTVVPPLRTIVAGIKLNF